jgi:ParB family chromosome partitioning protein
MNRRLGKGLDALISSLSVNEDDKIVEIPLSQLRPNPYQPRKNFSEEAIRELAESIREHGVIQPIIVREVLRGYEIIAGERRFRASELLGKATIPAVVRTYDDQQMVEIALIENLQREDLNALEVAAAYQTIMERFSLKQEELALKVGKSRSHIANFLRLLSLPQEVKDHVSRGTLSMGHARSLAAVKDETRCRELARLAVEKNWSVRELEQAVQNLDRKAKKPRSAARSARRDPYLEEIERNLREKFKTTVRIRAGRDKGKIEFSFYGPNDLERILQMLQVMA